MQAIFVAHGPFATQLKARLRKRDPITVIPGFANLEIYNLVTGLLGIDVDRRAPNNGTVGFWDRYIR